MASHNASAMEVLPVPDGPTNKKAAFGNGFAANFASTFLGLSRPKQGEHSTSVTQERARHLRPRRVPTTSACLLTSLVSFCDGCRLYVHDRCQSCTCVHETRNGFLLRYYRVFNLCQFPKSLRSLREYRGLNVLIYDRIWPWNFDGFCRARDCLGQGRNTRKRSRWLPNLRKHSCRFSPRIWYSFTIRVRRCLWLSVVSGAKAV